MTIAYDGTDFHGWQYQTNARTVQGEIEKAIEKVTGEKATVTGAGRTDQGVHARGQVANFHTGSGMPAADLERALNALVDRSIVITGLTETGADFHSRFSARGKIYRYHIIFAPSPFLVRYAWLVRYRLDREALAAACGAMKGRHDFRFFSMHGGEADTFCTVRDLGLTEEDAGIIIKIEGDRFLRKMIRGMVGFAVDAGRGRLKAGDAERAFGGEPVDLHFAPPQGLCLMEVLY